jgi:hypothetical protein
MWVAGQAAHPWYGHCSTCFCSWDHDVNGCSGGFMEGALDYIHEAGGATMETTYQ